MDEELLHRRIEALGQWLPQHTVFLDNRQMNGRPGFYVLTPLRLDGGAVVLVQRGWVPRNFEDRLRVPQIDTPAGVVKVQGRIAPAPSKLYEMGEAGTGAIRQNLDLAQFRAETGLALVAGSIQQTGAPQQDDGLLRDWPQISTGVDKHYGYAFQWFGLCALITLLYVWFQIVRRYKQRQA
jgi:surfeit locus 1 family protein